jgi:hypothetical protein
MTKSELQKGCNGSCMSGGMGRGHIFDAGEPRDCDTRCGKRAGDVLERGGGVGAQGFMAPPPWALPTLPISCRSCQDKATAAGALAAQACAYFPNLLATVCWCVGRPGRTAVSYSRIEEHG